MTTAIRTVLDANELAEYLGTGRTFARLLLLRGEIPSFKVGRLRRTTLADVEAYIERQRLAEGALGRTS